MIHYRTAAVGDHQIFYREAGDPNQTTLLLLYGFPSSSHMFRNLIPLLSDRFHIVAPDLPGFGFSQSPPRSQFKYTFDNLATVIEAFTEMVRLQRYALYVFDYGAPVGYRLAMRHPDRVTAIVSQNGNAYVEGLSDGWNPIRAYWKEPTQANRDALRTLLTPETTYWQYTTGVKDASLVSPDGYNLDNYYMTRPGAHDVQLDLFLDYASNVEMYPKFRKYFRQHQPPLLAVWGNGDPFFVPAGAEAFKRDITNAKVTFFDTGHFALETHCGEIAVAIRDFLPGAEVRAPRPGESPRGGVMLALEVVPLPVTDIDRALAFYTEQAGFTLDVDYRPTADFRVVQLTPPGSACSVQLVMADSPGRVHNLYLVTTDLADARAKLIARGVAVGAIRHKDPVETWAGGWSAGLDPKRRDYASFADFADPDGNTWTLQERGHRASFG